MDPYRLPRSVVPSRYDLRLEPDLTTSTFRGEVTIQLTVHETVTEILLNAIDLEIDETSVGEGASPGRSGRACGIHLDDATERCRLSVPTPLAPGQWSLHLKFRGTLNDQLRGFYRSSYTLPDGKQRY